MDGDESGWSMLKILCTLMYLLFACSKYIWLSESRLRFQSWVNYKCMKWAVEERQCTPHQTLVHLAYLMVRYTCTSSNVFYDTRFERSGPFCRHRAVVKDVLNSDTACNFAAKLTASLSYNLLEKTRFSPPFSFRGFNCADVCV